MGVYACFALLHEFIQFPEGNFILKIDQIIQIALFFFPNKVNIVLTVRFFISKLTTALLSFSKDTMVIISKQLLLGNA